MSILGVYFVQNHLRLFTQNLVAVLSGIKYSSQHNFSVQHGAFEQTAPRVFVYVFTFLLKKWSGVQKNQKKNQRNDWMQVFKFAVIFFFLPFGGHMASTHRSFWCWKFVTWTCKCKKDSAKKKPYVCALIKTTVSFLRFLGRKMSNTRCWLPSACLAVATPKFFSRKVEHKCNFVCFLCFSILERFLVLFWPFLPENFT